MSYQKFTVDNTTCSRRFHITFDSDAKPVAATSVSCPHCSQQIWSAVDHAPVTMARDENLVKTTQLSDDVIKLCKFKDRFVESKS